MSPKQMIPTLVQSLPDTATIDEIVDEIELIQQIELADAEVTAGRYDTHEAVVGFLPKRHPAAGYQRGTSSSSRQSFLIPE